MTKFPNDQYITILMQIKGDLGEVKGRLCALNELQEAHQDVNDRVSALEASRTRDRGFMAGVAFLASFLWTILSNFKGVIGL